MITPRTMEEKPHFLPSPSKKPARRKLIDAFQSYIDTQIFQ